MHTYLITWGETLIQTTVVAKDEIDARIRFLQSMEQIFGYGVSPDIKRIDVLSTYRAKYEP